MHCTQIVWKLYKMWMSVFTWFRVRIGIHGTQICQKYTSSERAWLYASGYPLKCIAPLFPIGTRNLHSSPYLLLPGANRPIGLWPIRSLAYSFPGTFAPWNFRSVVLSLRTVEITIYCETNSYKEIKVTWPLHVCCHPTKVHTLYLMSWLVLVLHTKNRMKQCIGCLAYVSGTCGAPMRHTPVRAGDRWHSLCKPRTSTFYYLYCSRTVKNYRCTQDLLFPRTKGLGHEKSRYHSELFAGRSLYCY